MAHWLFKQEPSVYNYSLLEKDRRTVWDGVSNNLALKHLRSVAKGDTIFLYHTGLEKSIVGVMRAASGIDSTSAGVNAAQVTISVEPVCRLPKPVSLSVIKNDPAFGAWELVRISRLSVMPVPDRMWNRVLDLGGVDLKSVLRS